MKIRVGRVQFVHFNWPITIHLRLFFFRSRCKNASLKRPVLNSFMHRGGEFADLNEIGVDDIKYTPAFRNFKWPFSVSLT